MTAYYNEIDQYAAEWLRNLIYAGHIAPGDIDTRSIEDVHPDDLRGYTQCHFFAGIGVWSYALRQAGWPDDRPVWTGSCPCQPFSTAGKGAGFADERHLWPAWHWLIQECRPATIFGEQVASKDGPAWLDLVQADLEGTGYTSGAVDTCAAGFGAPHIRQRLYWVAYADGRQLAGQSILRGVERDGQNARRPEGSGSAPACRDHGGLADADRQRRAQHAQLRQGESGRNEGNHSEATWSGKADRLADAESERWDGRESPPWAARRGCFEDSGDIGRPRPTNGFWRDADWLFCRDGRWRPVEPGTFPLVDGSAGRMGRVRTDQERLASILPRKDQGSRTGRLRGYGNAIVAPQAAEFIRAFLSCEVTTGTGPGGPQ